MFRSLPRFDWGVLPTTIGLIGLLGGSLANAQSPAGASYPIKPVRMIVGFPAGGGSDALARLLSGALTERFGQSFLVENRPGANTIVATEYVRTQPADGYTLLFVSASVAINPSLYKLSYDAERDFSPVSIVAIVPLLLVTPNSVPAKNVMELFALARAQPGKLSYASFGQGSSAHLAAEMLLLATGTDMIHVPYKGSAPAIQDVLGGRITMMVPGIGSAIHLAREGKLRALAVSTAKRIPGAPDVPTIAESGIPGFDVATWESVQVPTGTPGEIIARLNTAIREVIAGSELRQKMVALGFEPDATRTPAESAQFIRAERLKWGRVVKERNITVE